MTHGQTMSVNIVFVCVSVCATPLLQKCAEHKGIHLVQISATRKIWHRVHNTSAKLPVRDSGNSFLVWKIQIVCHVPNNNAATNGTTNQRELNCNAFLQTLLTSMTHRTLLSDIIVVPCVMGLIK